MTKETTRKCLKLELFIGEVEEKLKKHPYPFYPTALHVGFQVILNYKHFLFLFVTVQSKGDIHFQHSALSCRTEPQISFTLRCNDFRFKSAVQRA